MLAVSPAPDVRPARIARSARIRANPLSDHDRALEIGPREEDRELFAAQARGGVDRAQLAAQEVGERPQRLVAGRMPEAVVDPLEVVEVGEEERTAVRRDGSRA